MPNCTKQTLEDKHRQPPPLYFPPPPPRRAVSPVIEPAWVRLHAKDIGAQVARERSKALKAKNADGDNNDLRDRLVAVRADERLARERQRLGLPKFTAMGASLLRRMEKAAKELEEKKK